jgi:hypothetical protein
MNTAGMVHRTKKVFAYGFLAAGVLLFLGLGAAVNCIVLLQFVGSQFNDCWSETDATVVVPPVPEVVHPQPLRPSPPEGILPSVPTPSFNRAAVLCRVSEPLMQDVVGLWIKLLFANAFSVGVMWIFLGLPTPRIQQASRGVAARAERMA